MICIKQMHPGDFSNSFSKSFLVFIEVGPKSEMHSHFSDSLTETTQGGISPLTPELILGHADLIP